MSALLRVYLHPAIKGKIRWGEFVDVFSLLFGEVEPKVWAGDVPLSKEFESFQHPKVEHNWNWVLSYTIYKTVNFMPSLGELQTS